MKYLRRFLWYIAKRLLGLTILLGVLIIAFYMAMNTANITILLKDGMAMRAEVIMKQEDEAQLEKYFEENFLQVDTTLKVGLSENSPYKVYNMRGIDHRLTLEWLWCWPWDNTASANFVERVPKIDGRIKSSLRQQAEEMDPSRLYPPDWTSGRYVATLERINGRWKIASIKLLETVE